MWSAFVALLPGEAPSLMELYRLKSVCAPSCCKKLRRASHFCTGGRGLAGSRSKQMSKQNASPGKPSPRRRWKPRPEQHPRQENQDSQHVLTQPKRNAKFVTMFPKVSPKFALKFLVLSWQLENLPLKFQQSLPIRNFQHQTNVNVTKKSQGIRTELSLSCCSDKEGLQTKEDPDNESF